MKFLENFKVVLAIRVFKAVFAWIGVLLGILAAISAIVHLHSVGLKGVWLEIVSTYRDAMTPVYELVNIIPFPFVVPQYAVDLFTLYAVLCAMSSRAALWPLADSAVLWYQRRRDARKIREVVDEIPRPIPENFIYGERREDGAWDLWTYEFRPLSFTYGRAIFLVLIVWPVISLMPLRRLPLLKYAFRGDGREGLHGVEFGAEAGPQAVVSKPLLDLTKKYLEVTVEMVVVPLAILLFFILNAYAPL